MASTVTFAKFDGSAAGPAELPLTLEQYELLVSAGTFNLAEGQIELIHGRLVQMNPQGPLHSEPIDLLTEWSIENAKQSFRVRIEKPLSIAAQHSCPEPDVAWVKRRSYFDRHPSEQEVHLLIEISLSSQGFDRGEKRDLYASASVPEYWILDVENRKMELYRHPQDGVYTSISTHVESETISPLCLPTAKLFIGDLLIRKT